MVFLKVAGQEHCKERHLRKMRRDGYTDSEVLTVLMAVFQSREQEAANESLKGRSQALKWSMTLWSLPLPCPLPAFCLWKNFKSIPSLKNNQK